MPHPPAGSAGLLLVLGSSVLYGLNVGYARLASFAGVSGSTLVVYRVLIMLVVAGSVALVLGRSLQVARDERGIVGLLGITTALVSVGYLSSVAYIPVAVAVVRPLHLPDPHRARESLRRRDAAHAASPRPGGPGARRRRSGRRARLRGTRRARPRPGARRPASRRPRSSSPPPAPGRPASSPRCSGSTSSSCRPRP